jgi:hypothetical protein
MLVPLASASVAVAAATGCLPSIAEEHPATTSAAAVTGHILKKRI